MAESDRHTTISQSSEDLIGSRYALEVAFQTMKERCQRLQQRLARVEEENTKLRIQQKKEEKIEGSKGNEEVYALKETVARLERQKHQLTHHIHMVTSENKQLWNRVSQAVRMNQSLGNQLSKITDTLHLNPNPFETNLSKPIMRKQSMSYEISDQSSSPSPSAVKSVLANDASSTDVKVDSLEEISLKLINSFLQEKSELEDQCAQMTELQDGALSPSFSTDHLGMSMSSTNGSAGEENDAIGSVSVNEMQRLRDSLLHIKQEILFQQENLRSSVEQLCRIRDGGIICPSCKEHANNKAVEQVSQISTATTARLESATIAQPESFGDSADEEIKEELHRISENSFSGDHTNPLQSSRICPMCGRFYSDRAPFEDFHQHVVSHFESEGFDSIHDNFVVVSEGERV